MTDWAKDIAIANLLILTGSDAVLTETEAGTEGERRSVEAEGSGTRGMFAENL